jgi:hypothetical protein
MSAGFLHAVVCSPLQHMFPSARDALRCLSAIKALTKVKIASSGWDSNHIYSGNSPF